MLAQKAFQQLKRRLDYSEYGGAPLLGIDGIAIVCHGRSNANAIKNAVRVGKEFLEHKVNDKIEREFLKMGWSGGDSSRSKADVPADAGVDRSGVAG